MPRGVKGSGPVKEFMRVGALVITRPDQYNWQVDGDGRTTYHASLALAVKSAIHRASEAKSRTAFEWLARYEWITRDIEKSGEYLQRIERLKIKLDDAMVKLKESTR